MAKKISKNVGLVLTRKDGLFDLNTAYDSIKKTGKYAWGTGEVLLINEVENGEFNKSVLGLLKTSGEDEIIYGCTIDNSEEFRKYLKSNKEPKIQLDKKHKKYRPEHLKDYEDNAILFLTSIFLLKKPIRYEQIKVLNGNKFNPKYYRAAIFIDIKKSNLIPEEIYRTRKEFKSFSDNPLVQLLDYKKEDNLTNVFVYLLKNNDVLKKEFLKLCDIQKPIEFEIYTRKQLEALGNQEKSIPDITIEWNDGYKVLMEVKLGSKVDNNQLKKYKKQSKSKVISIAPSREEKNVKGFQFVSWEEIYKCITSVTIKKQKQKYLVEYFRDYLTNLGLSR